MRNLIYYILFFCLTCFLIAEEYEPLWQTRTENIRSTEFSKSGDVILVDTWDDITLIRTSDGEIIKIIPNVHYPKYSPDGSFFYFLRGNKVFKADSETYEETELFEVQSMYLTEFVYSQDLKYFIHPLHFDRSQSQVIGRGIDIYDLEAGELYRHIDHSVPASEFLSISYDNRYLAWNYFDVKEDGEFEKASVLYDLVERSEVQVMQQTNFYNFNENYVITSEPEGFLLRNVSDFSLIRNLTDLDFYFYTFSKWINGKEFMYSNRKGEVGIFNSESFENEIIETFHEFEGGNPGTPKFNFHSETGKFIFETSHYIRYYEIGSLLNISNENIYEITLSPNPANEQINISYILENPGSIEIFISDINGQEKGTIDKGFNTGTNQNLTYSINHLSSGKYFITLQINDMLITKSFVKE